MKPNYCNLRLLLFLMIFVACRKENKHNAPIVRQAQLQRIQKRNVITDYFYNEQGQLIAVKDSMAALNRSIITRLNYQQGRLSRTQYGELFYTTYTYPDASTVIAETGSAAVPLLYREIFSYNGERLLEIVRFDEQRGTPDTITRFTYDNTGNIMLQEEFSFQKNATPQWIRYASLITRYDNQPNLIYYHEKREYGFIEKNRHVLRNNPLRTEIYNNENRLIRTHQYHYTYDSEGRVSRRVEELVIENGLQSSDTCYFTFR